MPDLRALLEEAAGQPPDLPDVAFIRRRGDVLRTRRRLRWAAGALTAVALFIGAVLTIWQTGEDRLLVPAPQPSGTSDTTSVTNACTVGVPPGQRAIAYTHTNSGFTSSIWVMSPDGAAGRCVVDTPGPDNYPAWSPDGQWIAFVGGDGRREGVYRVRADGSDLTQVTRTPGLSYGPPVWSPDGRSLGYTVNGRTDIPSIHVVGIDGEADRVVLPEREGVWVALEDWSPDGQTLLFTRDDSLEGGHIGLWAMTPTGARERLLRAEKGDFGTGARFAGDGSRIAFQADLDGGCTYVSDPLLQQLTRVTQGCTQGGSVSWSPDGTQLVVAGGDHGPKDAVVVAADGRSAPRTITTGQTVAHVDWRPTPNSGTAEGVP